MTSNVFLQNLLQKASFRPAAPLRVPDMWRRRDIVVTCVTHPALPRKSCSSFKVAEGLLAASLPTFPLVFASGFVALGPFSLPLMKVISHVWKFFSSSPRWRLLTRDPSDVLEALQMLALLCDATKKMSPKSQLEGLSFKWRQVFTDSYLTRLWLRTQPRPQL